MKYIKVRQNSIKAMQGFCDAVDKANIINDCHDLPGEANRTSKRKRGDMRNKEYMEAIKEQTQNG